MEAGEHRLERHSDVLVVGAGPTGLTTALQAHDHGAAVRVVERRTEAFRPSRAMIVHPRTLENLRPLGVADALLERADTAPRAEVVLGRRRVAAELAGLALPDTAFPHLSLLRQADLEAVLARALERRGVVVERGVELLDAEHGADGGERATLRTPHGTERVACRFVAGCDGPASRVRSAAGIGWHGGPYREEVVLADVELVGGLEPGVLHVAVTGRGLVFVFALGEGAGWRLLATRPGAGPVQAAAFGQPGPPVPVAQIQRLLDESGFGVEVGESRWSSRVRLQHRVASSYRDRGLFLAGDAAHSYSPAGGQGMNTGIQDAANLGWKLAHAAAGRGDARLLDSYEQERRPVALWTLALTHLLFFGEASTHPLAVLLRGTLAPLAAPAVPFLTRRRRLAAEAVRLLSQLRVGYRRGALSRDCRPVSGRVPRPGRRLPDMPVECGGRVVRLHELTAAPGVHVLLSRDAEGFDARTLGPRVRVHRLTGWPGLDVVAVRPDGFVGFRCARADPARLGEWLRLVGAC